MIIFMIVSVPACPGKTIDYKCVSKWVNKIIKFIVIYNIIRHEGSSPYTSKLNMYTVLLTVLEMDLSYTRCTPSVGWVNWNLKIISDD